MLCSYHDLKYRLLIRAPLYSKYAYKLHRGEINKWWLIGFDLNLNSIISFRNTWTRVVHVTTLSVATPCPWNHLTRSTTTATQQDMATRDPICTTWRPVSHFRPLHMARNHPRLSGDGNNSTVALDYVADILPVILMDFST